MFTTKTVQQSPLNVRLPFDLAEKLERLTIATGRNKSTITVAALSSYVEHEEWQIQAIKSGIAQADNGEFASESEVNNFFSKYDC